MSLHPRLHMIYNMTSPVLRKDRKHDIREKKVSTGTQSLKNRNGEALPTGSLLCAACEGGLPSPRSGCRQIAAQSFAGNQGSERHCHPRSALLHCLRPVGEDL